MSGAKWAVLFAALIVGSVTAWAGDQTVLQLKELMARDKLDRHIDVDFQGMTLREVLEFFRHKLDMDVVLNNSASSFADRIITLQLKDVRARDALTRVLRQLELQYTLVDGILVVADRQSADAMAPMTLRQYDVGDLLLPVIP